MGRKMLFSLIVLLSVLLGGCAMRTVDQMYSLPKRSAEYHDLQRAIDNAMGGLEYCAPLSGENQQAVQIADLTGDGNAEYLLFARGSSENPMQILIFSRDSESCTLAGVIESPGSAFEQVEYVEMDGKPGLELVVGRQVSNQVLRNLAVYSFASGQAEQLMAVGYSKFLTADLDSDEVCELMTITPGQTETDNAVAVLYSWDDGTMTRSTEVSLSETAEHIKRMMVSSLHDGVPAIYVASAVAESAIITDVFAMNEGRFTNVSFSNESGTSVKTLRNYYVYADDIDDDGVLELPDLMSEEGDASTRHLIRWYAMTLAGEEVDKMYTFHNFDGGWFLRLDETWAPRVSVTREGSDYTFHVWKDNNSSAEKILSIYTLTGSDREEQRVNRDWFALYTTEGVVYAAELEERAAAYGITRESLMESLHPILSDWKTGETE